MTKRNPEVFIVYENAGNLAWWQGRFRKTLADTINRAGVKSWRGWYWVNAYNTAYINEWKERIAAQEGFA